MIRHILGKSWRIVNKILRKINHSPHSFEQINSPLERENLHSLKILANFLAPIRNSENPAAIINNLRLCSENLLKDAQISHWKRIVKLQWKNPVFPLYYFFSLPVQFLPCSPKDHCFDALLSEFYSNISNKRKSIQKAPETSLS